MFLTKLYTAPSLLDLTESLGFLDFSVNLSSKDFLSWLALASSWL